MLTYNPDPLKTNQRLPAPVMQKIFSYFEFFDHFLLRDVAKVFRENAEILMERAIDQLNFLEIGGDGLIQIRQKFAVSIYCKRSDWVKKICIFANLKFNIQPPRHKHVFYSVGAVIDVQRIQIPQYPPIFLAVATKNIDAVEFLLKIGLSCELPRNTRLVSPLTLACMQGSHEIAKTLLAHKANPEYSNNAPLRAAIKRGDRDLCHLLMDSGAASFLAVKEEKKETKGV